MLVWWDLFLLIVSTRIPEHLYMYCYRPLITLKNMPWFVTTRAKISLCSVGITKQSTCKRFLIIEQNSFCSWDDGNACSVLSQLDRRPSVFLPSFSLSLSTTYSWWLVKGSATFYLVYAWCCCCWPTWFHSKQCHRGARHLAHFHCNNNWKCTVAGHMDAFATFYLWSPIDRLHPEFLNNLTSTCLQCKLICGLFNSTVGANPNPLCWWIEFAFGTLRDFVFGHVLSCTSKLKSIEKHNWKNTTLRDPIISDL